MTAGKLDLSLNAWHDYLVTIWTTFTPSTMKLCVSDRLDWAYKGAKIGIWIPLVYVVIMFTYFSKFPKITIIASLIIILPDSGFRSRPSIGQVDFCLYSLKINPFKPNFFDISAEIYRPIWCHPRTGRAHDVKNVMTRRRIPCTGRCCRENVTKSSHVPGNVVWDGGRTGRQAIYKIELPDGLTWRNVTQYHGMMHLLWNQYPKHSRLSTVHV